MSSVPARAGHLLTDRQMKEGSLTTISVIKASASPRSNIGHARTARALEPLAPAGCHLEKLADVDRVQVLDRLSFPDTRDGSRSRRCRAQELEEGG